MIPSVPIPTDVPVLPSGSTATDQQRTGSYSEGSLTHHEQPPLPATIAHYEIRRELGRGGMGAVYLAWDQKLKRIVGLKVIRADNVGETGLQRFLQEAEAMAQLSHPGIVQIYEIGSWSSPQGTQPYIAVEYVEGPTLSHFLAGTPQPPRASAELVRHLAEALAFAHSKGILHRDLKPANILLVAGTKPESPPGAKIADFGLAKRLNEDSGRTQHGAVLGTPSYMPPEQAEGRATTTATDIWALGAILYECLTGRPPFKGASVPETLRLVTDTDPVTPRQLQPGLPIDLETICLKCLQKNPGSRYASASALADDLQRFLEGLPIEARRVGAMERAWKWAKRRPATAASLAGLTLALITGSAISTYFGLAATRNATAATERQRYAESQTRLAEQKEIQARESARQADEARTETELTAARSWMFRLGYRSGPLREAEEQALWSIASAKDDRLPLLFITDALEQSETAIRLARRADWITHAVCGLNVERRMKLVKLLAERLADSSRELPIRESCAELGAALAVRDPVFARLALVTIQTAAESATEPVRLQALARLCVFFASVLSHEEAVPATSAVAIKLVGSINRSLPSAMLVKGMRSYGSLVPYLDAENAGKGLAVVLTTAVHVRLHEYDHRLQIELDRALSAMLMGTPSDVARSAAESVVVALEGERDTDACKEHAQIFAHLTCWLKVEDRTRLVNRVVAALTSLLAKGDNQLDTTRLWSAGRRVIDDLDPTVAATSAQQVLTRMGKKMGGDRLARLGRLIDLLAGRMPTAEAAKVAESAANRIAESITPNAFPPTLEDLSETLAYLSRRLPAADAQTRVEKVIPKVMARQAKTTTPEELNLLAGALGHLLGVLEPPRATELALPVLDQLRDAHLKTPLTQPQAALTNGITHLLPRVPEAEASRRAAAILARILDTMSRNTAPGNTELYGIRLAATRLLPFIRSSEMKATVAKLMNAMLGTFRPDVAGQFSNLLQQLGEQMSPADRLETAMSIPTFANRGIPGVGGPPPLRACLESLQRGLSPVDSATLALKLIDTAERSAFGAIQSEMMSLLELIAPRITPERATTVRERAYALLRKADDAEWALIASAMSRLPTTLKADQVTLLTTQISKRLQATNSSFRIEQLATISALLAEKMNPEKAQTFMKGITARVVQVWEQHLEPEREEHIETMSKKPRSRTGDSRNWDMPRFQSALVAVAPWLEPAERSSLVTTLVDHLARNEEIEFAALLERTFADLVAPMEPTAIVEILKRPTCVGPARGVMLRSLSATQGEPAMEADPFAMIAGSPANLALFPGGRRTLTSVWQLSR